MPLQPIPTSLDVILPVLRARLVSVTGLPAERVGALQRNDVPFNAHGDNYVFLRVEDSSFDMADIIGAGRIDSREEVLLSLTVRSRLATDEANMDWKWLTDESYGNLRLRHRCIDALLCFQPLDDDGNWLVTEPIKPTTTRRPRKEEGKAPNREWGESTTWWKMTYHLDLDQLYQ